MRWPRKIRSWPWAFLEGAAIIEPRVGPAASAFRAISFETGVRRALERVRPEGASVAAAEPPIDLAIIAPSGKVLVSVVHRRSSSLQRIDLAPLVSSRQLEEAVGGLAMFGVPEEPALDLASHLNPAMADCILDLYRSAVDVGRQWGPEFEAIPAPRLVIIPSEDAFLNAASAARAAARADAKTAAIDGLGHWWMLQDPVRAATVLREFWATLA
jgi:hypothetical protein